MTSRVEWVQHTSSESYYLSPTSYYQQGTPPMKCEQLDIRAFAYMYDDPMRNLMIMRHGKSNWDADALSDHARPLANRGIVSAERMGEVIRDLGIIPGLVISSTAVRARATAELARITGGWASRLILDDDLYGASPVGALEVVARHAGDCERVMIVGHEPTWSMLIKRLTGGSVAVRTATVADVEMHISRWDTAASASGTLVSLLQPRGFMRS